jgi:seryl-tRNA synthetase
MLDVKLIREQQDFVRERLASRGAGDDARLAEVVALDERRRKALTRRSPKSSNSKRNATAFRKKSAR